MTAEAGARVKVIYHNDIPPPRYSDEDDKLKMRDLGTNKHKNNNKNPYEKSIIADIRIEKYEKKNRIDYSKII